MVANNSNSVQHTGRAPASPLVTLSACLVLLSAGGSLVIRVYFVHGGPHLWVSTMMQVGGWPLLLPIWASLLLLRDGGGAGISVHLRSPHRAGFLAVFGACFAIACFAYSLGSQSLPLSTSAVLQATQLAFNAIFAFLFAGLRFTPFSVNAVVLLSMGPAVLGARPLPEEHLASRGSWEELGRVRRVPDLGGGSGSRPAAGPGHHVEGARPPERRRRDSTAAAAVVRDGGPDAGPDGRGRHGSVPRRHGRQQDIPGSAGRGRRVRARRDRLLPAARRRRYFGSSNLGVMALIVCSSSLLAGIMIALVLPLSEVLAVIFLHEKFDGVKGIALVLCLWGFVSYLYGESARKKMKATGKQVAEGSKDLESIRCPLVAP